MRKAGLLGIWGVFWCACVSLASSYDSGRIQVKEGREGGEHVAEFRPKAAMPSGELTALTHLHMARVCGRKFYFQTRFERTPGSPAEAPMSFARTRFECRRTPDFFGGQAGDEKLYLREMCGEADTQVEYLQALCRGVIGR